MVHQGEEEQGECECVAFLPASPFADVIYRTVLGGRLLWSGAFSPFGCDGQPLRVGNS
jgi:hypothetical protein